MTTTALLIDDIRDLVNQSVTDVFATMFTLEAQPAPELDLRTGTEALVVGSVGFIGDVNGVVYIFVRAGFARTLASRMLGLSEAEIEGDEMVTDVIGELSNMVVGAVKSQLCDRGLSCVLTIPSVVRGQGLATEPVNSVERRLLGFNCGIGEAQVELQLKISK